MKNVFYSFAMHKRRTKNRSKTNPVILVVDAIILSPPVFFPPPPPLFLDFATGADFAGF